MVMKENIAVADWLSAVSARELPDTALRSPLSAIDRFAVKSQGEFAIIVNRR